MCYFTQYVKINSCNVYLLLPFSACVFNIVGLKQLEIAHNKIKHIPPDIARLKNLWLLDIR